MIPATASVPPLGSTATHMLQIIANRQSKHQPCLRTWHDWPEIGKSRRSIERATAQLRAHGVVVNRVGAAGRYYRIVHGTLDSSLLYDVPDCRIVHGTLDSSLLYDVPDFQVVDGTLRSEMLSNVPCSLSTGPLEWHIVKQAAIQCAMPSGAASVGDASAAVLQPLESLSPSHTLPLTIKHLDGMDVYNNTSYTISNTDGMISFGEEGVRGECERGEGESVAPTAAADAPDSSAVAIISVPAPFGYLPLPAPNKRKSPRAVQVGSQATFFENPYEDTDAANGAASRPTWAQPDADPLADDPPPKSGRRKGYPQNPPDVFPVTPQMVSWWRSVAKPDGIVPTQQTEGEWLAWETDRCLDWHRANGTRACDWLALWRNWMRKAIEIFIAAEASPARKAGRPAQNGGNSYDGYTAREREQSRRLDRLVSRWAEANRGADSDPGVSDGWARLAAG